MDEDEKKKVDESWKETVEKEKIEKPPGQQPQGQQPQGQKENLNIPTPDFKFFLSTLSLQALISLGEIDNPATKKRELELNQAKFIIDTLDMLKQKTDSNLSEDESGLLDNMLYELKMKYVEKGG